MKTKKGLLEKRTALKGKLDGFKDSINNNTVTDDQLDEIRSIKDKISKINEDIATLDEERRNAVPANNGSVEMEKSKFKALEKRAAADMIRGKLRGSQAAKDYIEAVKTKDEGLPVESRDLSDNGLSWSNAVSGTASNGGVLIPTTVANTIVQKLQETSPVFALSNKVGSVNGNLEVCLLYTSPSPRDDCSSRMPSSA